MKYHLSVYLYHIRDFQITVPLMTSDIIPIITKNIASWIWTVVVVTKKCMDYATEKMNAGVRVKATIRNGTCNGRQQQRNCCTITLIILADFVNLKDV